MEIATERIRQLTIKYLDEGLTEIEREELETWMNISEENRETITEFLDDEKLKQGIKEFFESKDRIWRKIEEKLPDEKVIPIRRSRFLKWIAAAVVIFIVTGYWLLVRDTGSGNRVPEVVTQEERFKNDIEAPQNNRATLTLENGTVIFLDSVGNGELVIQTNAKVIKNGDMLRYSQESALPFDTAQGKLAQVDKEVKYNTLTVPKGSRPIQLTLADGTQVWLDALSSITYPTAFVGYERKVKMSGQAYFEVSPLTSPVRRKADAPSERGTRTPFIVEANEVSTEVLGTHFNVNAFDSEVKVTLLEGSVEVQSQKSKIKIKPGEQGIGKVSGELSVVSGVDVDEVMAWKNGLFKFKEVTIETVMKQLERWYDVEVVYEEKVSDHFVTTVPRSAPISQVLKYLETTGRVHFRIDGRKIVVSK